MCAGDAYTRAGRPTARFCSPPRAQPSQSPTMRTLAVVMLAAAAAGSAEWGVPGGLTLTKCDEKCERVAMAVKPDVKAKVGDFAEYKPVGYRKQVVAGTMWFIKVAVGKGTYIHVKVMEPLPKPATDKGQGIARLVRRPPRPMLRGVLTEKQWADEVESFPDNRFQDQL
eukprot:TRINITY_DN12574_c0_g3_i2.p1 TRINITY_DN12574_c0_g3~~TRINITY_DN12574_c0_g3_i2.p1  ORF type:complete len:169 (+),score=37.44 TRINITY_DN12574_c0_g3_i2:638-1144(+)